MKLIIDLQFQLYMLVTYWSEVNFSISLLDIVEQLLMKRSNTFSFQTLNGLYGPQTPILLYLLIKW